MIYNEALKNVCSVCGAWSPDRTKDNLICNNCGHRWARPDRIDLGRSALHLVPELDERPNCKPGCSSCGSPFERCDCR